MTNKTDILVKSFNKGNEESYIDLFEMMYAPLCQFCEKYVINRALAEDIVQEIFVKLFEGALKFDSFLLLKVYLYRCVKNASLNHLKKYDTVNTCNSDNLHEKSTESNFLTAMLEQEVIVELHKAVGELTDKRREIIELSLAGLSNVEIADNLSVSINTIKTQKKIAYSDLRMLLKPAYSSIIFLFLN